jgi:hypothetical protein
MTSAVPAKPVHEVFGLAPEVRPDSYVDRGALDAQISGLLENATKHVALRGVSKCGKSWLRQRVISNALVIQCRLGKTVLDIYREALGALNIRLEVSRAHESTLTGSVEATAEAGNSLLAKVSGKWGLGLTNGDVTTTELAQAPIHDLSYIADLLKASGRRLVIEDFHYLSQDERKKLAFDMKALWDYQTFVVIVGVWSEKNQLIELNPDLGGRVREVSIHWDDADLHRIFERGGEALNIEFGQALRDRAVADCYGNAGILQRLIEGTLESAGVKFAAPARADFDDLHALEDASLTYADELNSLYLKFAERVSKGVRRRKNGTGIYGHAMAVLMDATDEELIAGVPLQTIYTKSHARERRIQPGNLRTALERIETLQVDDDGRGLVLAYDTVRKVVSVVDRQLLLFRKYSTVPWPWEDLIAEATESAEDQFVITDGDLSDV